MRSTTPKGLVCRRANMQLNVAAGVGNAEIIVAAATAVCVRGTYVISKLGGRDRPGQDHSPELNHIRACTERRAAAAAINRDPRN